MSRDLFPPGKEFHTPLSGDTKLSVSFRIGDPTKGKWLTGYGNANINAYLSH